MIEYLGVLTEAHFHAVVRAALRAHGLHVPPEALSFLDHEQAGIGKQFTECVYPGLRPSFADTDDLQDLAEHNPRLSQRLPLLFALGWRQVAVLNALASGPPSDDDTAALHLGALFNAAISVIDYVADERPGGAIIFELLDARLVRAVFDPKVDIENRLAAVYRGSTDPYQRLILALVGAWALQARRLLARSGNHVAWHALAQTIDRLHGAEYGTLRSAQPCAAADIQRMRVDTWSKSVLPSVAALLIAQLARPFEGPAPSALSAAQVLGEIFRQTDDLADLLSDCRSGHANGLLEQVQAVAAADGRLIAADADLYQVVDGAARNLVSLLEPRAFAAQEFASAYTAAFERLTQFARVYVAAWVGWRDDRPIAPPMPALQLPACATMATSWLLQQQALGWPEAVHHLRLPRGDGRFETHPATLFFRALTLDALLDARAAGLDVPGAVLDAEGLVLLQHKHRAVRGGWSYLASVPELPPDADDNGQVLQALARLGGPALAESCDECIRLHLDAMTADGGVQTWILDPSGRSSADMAVRRYVGVMGGWGVHVEVVANLACGLIVLDAARYAGPLQRMAAFLQAQQTEDGSWASSWYDGPYYGSFRAVTVLAAVRPGSPALTAARHFLLDRQRGDGGWGTGASDPLSTSCALLALCQTGVPNQAVLAAGLRCLERMAVQASFPASPFIRFPTQDGGAVYGSRTASTAFCLKALLATSAVLAIPTQADVADQPAAAGPSCQATRPVDTVAG